MVPVHPRTSPYIAPSLNNPISILIQKHPNPQSPKSPIPKPPKNIPIHKTLHGFLPHLIREFLRPASGTSPPKNHSVHITVLGAGVTRQAQIHTDARPAISRKYKCNIPRKYEFPIIKMPFPNRLLSSSSRQSPVSCANKGQSSISCKGLISIILCDCCLHFYHF